MCETKLRYNMGVEFSGHSKQGFTLITCEHVSKSTAQKRDHQVREGHSLRLNFSLSVDFVLLSYKSTPLLGQSRFPTNIRVINDQT